MVTRGRNAIAGTMKVMFLALLTARCN